MTDEAKLLNVKPKKFIPQYVFCADLSLRQPGFAVISVSKTGRMKVEETVTVHNRNKAGTHGELLTAIGNAMHRIVSKFPKGVKVAFVRERAFSRFANETQTLNKVVGLADYLLAKEFTKNIEVQDLAWIELAPKTIRVLVCGSGNAKKEDVQRDLVDFVGNYEYKNTDESDAVAAGVAYLIKEGMGKPRVSRSVSGSKDVAPPEDDEGTER